MWAMAKHMGFDFATLIRIQTENKDLPCRTVRQAVDA